MPNYTIWTMHGELGVNVLHENDDDEPGVNIEPIAIVNDMFRNTLADDTEDNDDIS